MGGVWLAQGKEWMEEMGKWMKQIVREAKSHFLLSFAGHFTFFFFFFFFFLRGGGGLISALPVVVKSHAYRGQDTVFNGMRLASGE